MKKIIVLLATVVLLVSSVCLFSSCEDHQHMLTLVEAQDPTCTESGMKQHYECSVCNRYFEDAECKVELDAQDVIVRLLGHDWDGVGCTEAKTCKTCGETSGDALGHDWVNANCTSPKTCKVCNETEGEAWGHDWVDATCTEAKTCRNCKATEGEKLGHTEMEAVKKNVVASTCTATGSYETVVYCSVCDAELERETHTTEILPHTEVVDEAEAATCTEDGLTEGKHCDVCGETLVAQNVVPASGHSFGNNGTQCGVCGEECLHGETEVIEGTAATCTEAGLTDGTKCLECKTVIVKQETIPVIPHTPNAEAVKANIVDATKETAGSYDSVVNCSECGNEVSRTTVAIPAFNGTDYTFAVATKDDKTGDITITYTLKADSSFTYTQAYTSFLQIEDVYYVEDTLDAISIDGATVTYADNCFSFATSKTVNLTILLAYGDAPVVVTGDVVITRDTRLNNNGGLIIGTETTEGNYTINITANADGMKFWNQKAKMDVVNGTFTVNGNDSTYAGNKAGIWVDSSHSYAVITIGPKGNVVFTNYKYSIGGYSALIIQNDISVTGLGGRSIDIADGVTVTAGAISCSGAITGNGDIIIDGSIVTPYTASNVAGNVTCNTFTLLGGETVSMVALTANRAYDECTNANAEFGFEHAIKIENGILNVTGKITTTGIKVGSLLNGGTKGYINAKHAVDGIIRVVDQGARYDFVNGEATFVSTDTKMAKSLFMIDYDVVANITVMENFKLTGENYDYFFYGSKGSANVKTFTYCDGTIRLVNCENELTNEVKIVRNKDDRSFTPVSVHLEAEDNKAYYVVNCTIVGFDTAEAFYDRIKFQFDGVTKPIEVSAFDAAAGTATFRVDITSLAVASNAHYTRGYDQDQIYHGYVGDFKGLATDKVDTATVITVGEKKYQISYASGKVNGYGTVAVKVTAAE